MDMSKPVFPVPSGIYQIRPVPATRIAKMDAWAVEITLLSVPYDRSVAVSGVLQREDAMGALGGD